MALLWVSGLTGLDLGDWYCRLVIVVGLPYASTSDPRVTLKKMFLDRQRAMVTTAQNPTMGCDMTTPVEFGLSNGMTEHLEVKVISFAFCGLALRQGISLSLNFF